MLLSRSISYSDLSFLSSLIARCHGFDRCSFVAAGSDSARRPGRRRPAATVCRGLLVTVTSDTGKFRRSRLSRAGPQSWAAGRAAPGRPRPDSELSTARPRPRPRRRRLRHSVTLTASASDREALRRPRRRRFAARKC